MGIVDSAVNDSTVSRACVLAKGLLLFQEKYLLPFFGQFPRDKTPDNASTDHHYNHNQLPPLSTGLSTGSMNSRLGNTRSPAWVAFLH
jgi:hypothetical protein